MLNFDCVFRMFSMKLLLVSLCFMNKILIACDNQVWDACNAST